MWILFGGIGAQGFFSAIKGSLLVNHVSFHVPTALTLPVNLEYLHINIPFGN